MTATRPSNKTTWALGLLGVLMCSHLAFLGFRSEGPDQFQRAAETYVTIILALMAPLPSK
jgi:hypothetical protein